MDQFEMLVQMLDYIQNEVQNILLSEEMDWQVDQFELLEYIQDLYNTVNVYMHYQFMWKSYVYSVHYSGYFGQQLIVEPLEMLNMGE